MPAEDVGEDIALGGTGKEIDLTPVEIEFEQLYASAEEPQKKLVHPIDLLDERDIEVANHREKRDLISNNDFISSQWRQNGKKNIQK